MQMCTHIRAYMHAFCAIIGHSSDWCLKFKYVFTAATWNIHIIAWGFQAGLQNMLSAWGIVLALSLGVLQGRNSQDCNHILTFTVR